MGKPFGKLLRELRRANEKNLGDVAEYLGVSVSYISAIERGTRGPLSKSEIIKVLKYLNASDRFSEFEMAANQARKRIEFPIEKQSESVVQLLTSLARVCEENKLDEEKIRLLKKLLEENP